MKKVTSQKEANDIFDFLVKTTVETLKIEKDDAEYRVSKMLNWIEKENINPLTPLGQKRIDDFLRNFKYSDFQA